MKKIQKVYPSTKVSGRAWINIAQAKEGMLLDEVRAANEKSVVTKMPELLEMQ